MDNTAQLAQHGEFLRERNRYDEAIATFKQALAQAPNDASLHSELALTYLEHPDDGKNKDALSSINNAIGLEPEGDYYFSIKGLILMNLSKSKEARKAAEEAIALNPDNALAWTVKGTSFFDSNKWAEAEEAVREALAIDPDFDYAKNMLSIILRAQGKVEQSEEEIASVLSRNAEDPIAHANAGWAALHNGKRNKAEEHFREALRVDPENEFAREGLREAYKARSLFFRIYLKYVFFMQRFSAGAQWAMFIGLYLAFKFGRAFLATIHPLLSGALVVLYLLFAFGTFLANGIGHFLLLKDPLARLTLNKNEKLDGLFVGGGLFLGVILALIGYLVGFIPLMLLGGALVLGTIPWSRVFTNESMAGKVVFGAVGSIIYLLGAVAVIVNLSLGQSEEATQLTTGIAAWGVILSFLSTWISMIPGIQK